MAVQLPAKLNLVEKARSVIFRNEKSKIAHIGFLILMLQFQLFTSSIEPI